MRACVCADYLATLLDRSYRNLHEMFTRTYGLLYEQNADIFVDLFVNLRADLDADDHHRRRYRDRGFTEIDTAEIDIDIDSAGGVDVRLSLDRFFAVLMRRMLTLLSRHRAAPPTDRFLYCVSSRIDQLRPFGDVPAKLSAQLHRAFIAARALVVGLTTGADIIATLSQVRAKHRTHARTPVQRPFFPGLPG